LSVAQKRFFQDGALVFQLRGVTCVLVMAATACAKIGTMRRNPIWRRLDDLVSGGAGKAAFFLDDRGAYFFRGQHKWRKDRLPFRKPGEAVATVHEFFDCEVQR